MRDLFYVLAAIGFFIIMLAYVAACEALGSRSAETEGES